MRSFEQVELLRAVLAVAVADGTIRAPERGVIEGLAARAGIGRMSLQAMIDRAQHDAAAHQELRDLALANAEKALELLVATAAIDGDIHEQERAVLVEIASALRIDPNRFPIVYEQGVKRAAEVRRRRGS